jgi:cytochrome P450
VFADRVGVPVDDKAWIADTIAQMMQALVTTDEMVVLAADEASDAVEEYFREKVAERRARPEDDMITRLVAVHDSYEPEDDKLLIAILWITWMTGYESTISGIDRSVQAAPHPHWLPRLADRRGRVEGAVVRGRDAPPRRRRAVHADPAHRRGRR